MISWHAHSRDNQLGCLLTFQIKIGICQFLLRRHQSEISSVISLQAWTSWGAWCEGLKRFSILTFWSLLCSDSYLLKACSNPSNLVWDFLLFLSNLNVFPYHQRIQFNEIIIRSELPHFSNPTNHKTWLFKHTILLLSDFLSVEWSPIKNKY